MLYIKVLLFTLPLCSSCFAPFKPNTPSINCGGYYRTIPQSPKCEMNFLINYQLVTRNTVSAPFNFSSEKLTLDGSTYNSSKGVFILFHGWWGNPINNGLVEICHSFLKQVDGICLLVDYSSINYSEYDYPQAVADICCVCDKVVKLANYLINEKGTKAEDIHLSGISLGAQLSGCIGKLVPGIGRITGMDPAGPLFDVMPGSGRLIKGDAKFVEVIQTNSGFLGTTRPSGDSIFRMNGGMYQPGCFNDTDIASNFDIGNVNSFPICSHGRSVVYNNESMSPDCKFWGALQEIGGPKPCDPTKNCAALGLDANKYPARGTFVLSTNSKYPFCRGNTTNAFIVAPSNTNSTTAAPP